MAHVSQGGGGVSVNSRPLLSYFPLPEQRQQVLFPLVATETLGGVEVSARVRGGGKTGKCGPPLSLRLSGYKLTYVAWHTILCRSGWGCPPGY